MGFNPAMENLDLWKSTLEKAKQQGLIVVHCAGGIAGAGCPVSLDRDDPANYCVCHFTRSWDRSSKWKDAIYLPIDNRTTAGYLTRWHYIFWAEGGLSWGAPYLAGLIALAYQVRPSLDEETVWRYLRETGTPFDLGRLVNPKGFIERVKMGG